MTAAEIRWRCERLEQLLQTESRADALASAEVEARSMPWLVDARPAFSIAPGGYVCED